MQYEIEFFDCKGYKNKKNTTYKQYQVNDTVVFDGVKYTVKSIIIVENKVENKNIKRVLAYEVA